MNPVNVDLTYRTGDTPRLRFQLFSRNVRSGALALRCLSPDVVEWTVYWPGENKTVVDTSAAASGQTPAGRLEVDPRSGTVTHPLTAADLLQVEPGVRVPFKVVVINGEGNRLTYATGTIGREGAA